MIFQFFCGLSLLMLALSVFEIASNEKVMDALIYRLKFGRIGS